MKLLRKLLFILSFLFLGFAIWWNTLCEYGIGDFPSPHGKYLVKLAGRCEIPGWDVSPAKDHVVRVLETSGEILAKFNFTGYRSIKIPPEWLPDKVILRPEIDGTEAVRCYTVDLKTGQYKENDDLCRYDNISPDGKYILHREWSKKVLLFQLKTLDGQLLNEFNEDPYSTWGLPYWETGLLKLWMGNNKQNLCYVFNLRNGKKKIEKGSCQKSEL